MSDDEEKGNVIVVEVSCKEPECYSLVSWFDQRALSITWDQPRERLLRKHNWPTGPSMR